jgi:hypothetical protein
LQERENEPFGRGVGARLTVTLTDACEGVVEEGRATKGAEDAATARLERAT